jgi:hypothetical protein
VLFLIIKLLLVPFLIAAITIAGERFGPRIAGALTGLPVVAGPIVFVMALEQGAAFAARSAAATLAGIGSLAVFCVLYAAAALRTSWITSLAVGWAGFAASTLALDRLDPSFATASGLAITAPLVVTTLAPRPAVIEAASGVVPRAEIVLRMAAGVVLMLVLTALAHVLGPRLSGLLTVFPIATTILAVFSHRNQGGAFAVYLLRGLAAGLYSLGAFFLTLSATLAAWGVAPAFGAALVAALAAQTVVLGVVRRSL